jgi:hypothetical protein
VYPQTVAEVHVSTQLRSGIAKEEFKTWSTEEEEEDIDPDLSEIELISEIVWARNRR